MQDCMTKRKSIKYGQLPGEADRISVSQIFKLLKREGLDRVAL